MSAPAGGSNVPRMILSIGGEQGADGWTGIR
jgi:hypothetical protein